MPERIEITDLGGSSRIVTVEGDTLLFGSGTGVDVREQATGLEPRHLRFVRTDHGFRVEPVRPGATVLVNGESLFCKDLDPDDLIEVAGLRLRWLAEPQSAAVRAAEPAVADARRDRPAPVRTQRARRRATKGYAVVSSVFLAIVIAIVLVLRGCAGSTWPRSPQHYVDLARAQLGNNQPQRALDTLAFALRDATGATREEALALEAEIRRAQLENSELPRVVAARQAHDLLQSFVSRYLRDGAPRPAAREFVRSCDEWLQNHAEVCRRHTDGQPLLRAVEDLRSRYVAPAALGEPDTAEDVVFAARARLRFQWRDYRGAMQVLDRFLAASPGAASVQKERELVLTEGEQWIRQRLRNVDLLLDRGDTGNAAQDLAQIEKWSMLPQWEAMVGERRKRLASAR